MALNRKISKKISLVVIVRQPLSGITRCTPSKSDRNEDFVHCNTQNLNNSCVIIQTMQKDAIMAVLPRWNFWINIPESIKGT